MKIVKGEVLFTREQLMNFLVRIAKELRHEGIGVSTGELEASIKLIENYCALQGKIYEENHVYFLTVKELMELLKASLLKHDRFENVFEKVVEETLIPQNIIKNKFTREIETYLKELGLRFGEKIPLSKMKRIIRRRNGRDKIFNTLSKMGVIVKNRKYGFYEILDEKSIDILLSKNITMFKSISELANNIAYRRLEKSSLRRIYDEKDFYLDTIEAAIDGNVDLTNLSINKLIGLSKIAYLKGKTSLSKRIANIVAQRILKNNVEAKSADEETLVDVLEKTDMLTPEIIEAIIKGNPRIADKLLKRHREHVLLSLKNIDDVDAQKTIASKALKFKLKRKEIETLVNNLRPEALGVFEKYVNYELSRREEILIKAAAKLAKAFEYFRKAFTEDNEGYLDMAYGVLEDYGKLMNKYRREIKGKRTTLEMLLEDKISLLNTLLSMVTSSYPTLPSKLRASPTMETLYVLKEVYDAAVDPRAKKKILSIASIVAQKLKSKIRSSIISRKYVKSSLRSSSIVIRDSIYNVLRKRSSPLVYRRRKRARKITLLIDVSGSMKSYAQNAILIASAFIRIVGNVIVFRENVLRVNKNIIRNPARMVEFLFNLKFGGWTNISKALEEARKLRSKTVVLISDLKQTVSTKKPSIEAKELMKSGTKLVIITPPLYDKALANEMKLLGAKIINIRDSSELIKALSFAL